jgi:hypothetical protein
MKRAVLSYTRLALGLLNVTKGLTMQWTRSLLVGAVTLATVVLSTTGVQISSTVVAHAAGCDTWYGPGGGPSGATSGLWGVSSNWSTGVIPATPDDVCITDPGTYTVTLAPWSLGTADPNNDGSNVNSLTLGATSGAQTLDIAGQASISNSNETVNTVFLNMASSSTINSNGTVILDSTAGGTSAGGAPPSGGSATLSGGPLTSYGHVETQVEDTFPGAGTFLSLYGFTNEPGASLSVSTGTLTEGEVNTSSATNEGTVTVATGASLVVTPNTFSTTTFTNQSSVVNNGSITVNGATWAQSAGSITGNAVVLQSAATLADAAGPAQFIQNYGSATITGTIASGQTVTVLGEPFNYGGETYYSSTASLGGAQLVNDGNLIFKATGTGATSGGSVYLTHGAVLNNGTISAEVLDPSWSIHLQVPISNSHGGTISVTGGQFLQDSGTATTNDGHVTIGPGATYVLAQGSSFANKTDGTTIFQIASATHYGTFGLTGPCCAGPGVYSAGGTMSPALIGSYKPPANKEFQVIALEGGTFKGKFTATGHDFSADYSHHSSNPAFIGAIYAVSLPRPRVVSVSTVQDKVVVVLSCAAGGAACSAASFKASVTEHLTGGRITALFATSHTSKATSTIKHVVVATGAASLSAGLTRSITVVVNRAGLALLSKFKSFAAVVTVISGGKTIRSAVIVLHRPVPKKK